MECIHTVLPLFQRAPHSGAVSPSAQGNLLHPAPPDDQGQLWQQNFKEVNPTGVWDYLGYFFIF